MNDLTQLYTIQIYERFKDLLNSGKNTFDNNDLCKIFEYYCCLGLSRKYKKQFYMYDDIDPTFKEENKMSKRDTGIDLCNLIDTIVQCKLRKNTLSWRECATFFGSQNMYDVNLQKTIVKWNNLIITRNKDCTLSENLLERKQNKLYMDIAYDKNKMINYCYDLFNNPPNYPEQEDTFELRDYQIEIIKLIKENNKNIIISIPTGTGKNIIIMNSFKKNKKYLVLVPRIILMEQLKDEIIEHFSKMKNKIQMIGDNNDVFDENKNVII